VQRKKPTFERSKLLLERESLETLSSRRPLWVKPNWSKGTMGRSSSRISEKRISEREEGRRPSKRRRKRKKEQGEDPIFITVAVPETFR